LHNHFKIHYQLDNNSSQLNLEYFIAKRLLGRQNNAKSFSRPIITIAVIGIALGLSVMILSAAIVTGFKNEIRNKVIGFGSHVQIINYDSNVSFETSPVIKDSALIAQLKKIKEIKHVQVFSTKPGIIRTENDIQGIVLKGIDTGFNWSFFEKNIIEGEILAGALSDSALTNEVVISKTISSLLKLQVGSEFAMYFVQDPPRMRRFKVSGIYETGLGELDKLFVLCDIRHIQRLNQWDENQISGYEIQVENFQEIDRISETVFDAIGYGFSEESWLRVISIKDKYPQFFDWLGLLDMNVWIILALMLLVAGFNMVSGLLIIILERTNMIGILKALGINNLSLRKVFLYLAGFLVAKGLLWGNILGIGIALLQKYTGMLKLDQTSYFIDVVPVNLNLVHILSLNLGTMVLTIAMLIIPSYVISKISPDKTIRFN
jgi:lipoprotein-releasing system permease protein